MILLGLFIISVLIQIFFHFFIFGRFAFLKNGNQDIATHAYDEGVSVIVCAKNEQHTISNCMASIINQNYPKYELILVDDGSSDDTLNLMHQCKKKFKCKIDIRIFSISSHESTGGKKNALAYGISNSKFEHILLTDADCYPKTSNWITSMQSNFNKSKKVVLGYGAYEKKSNSILNKLIRFETLLTAIQYFSYAKIGIPYMGVGRNLAYKKSLFNQVNGFNSHNNVISGDDDLLINQIATKNNIEICFRKDSFTLSEPENSFKRWFNQKRRHVSTSSHYKLLHKFLLGLFYTSQLFFWILGIASLIYFNYSSTIWFLIGLRMIFWFVTIVKSSKKLHEMDLIIMGPFLELFLILFQLCIFIFNIISPKKKWL